MDLRRGIARTIIGQGSGDRPGTYTISLTASNVDGESNALVQEITLFDGIDIDFSATVLESNFPPVEVVLTNGTNGVGLTYEWTFEGADPESSTRQRPDNVVFDTPGEHKITLAVSNGFETLERDTLITVLPDIDAAFAYKVDFDDDDFQAPVTLSMSNTSTNATTYKWTFANGTPASSTDKDPTVTFDTPGTYTMALLADNGKKTDTVRQTVTVLPNTNLRTFTDVRFGTNAAHNGNAIGAFFSTKTRKRYSSDQVNAANGVDIDLVFIGLNSSFSFNRFVSPTAAQDNGFMAVPNARHTKVINSQEICACGGLTDAQFDAMVDDTLLEALVIEETAAGLQAFDQVMLPRIVLFETADGKKGAIKVKGFISDGDNSYINTDIKIQKEP